MEPAWKDVDDEHLQLDLTSRKLKGLADEGLLTGPTYVEKLRSLHSSMYQPTWVQATTHDRRTILGLLSTSKAVLSDKTAHLLPHNIEIEQLPHANSSSYSSSVVNAVEFHNDFLLTAGNDKKLKVFRFSEQDNSLELSVHLKDLPIKSAKVVNGKVFLAGDRSFFYTFDLLSSKLTRVPGVVGHQNKQLKTVIKSPDSNYATFLTDDGYLLFTSPNSTRLLFELKMNGTAQAASFADDTTIYSGGSEGDVYEWDLRTRRCVRRFADEGNTHVTALSATETHLATGSSSGVVNLYDRRASKFSEGLPEKSLLNLTTSVDGVSFNSSSELLLMHSRWKKDALRLVHVASRTTYANWPNFKSHLMLPFCASFSADSKYLCVGNEEGQVTLNKLIFYHSRAI
mmetsp:Transcript_9469/g.18261  ORF Transcript_9469/g.18261 Transcript_9469/m.18261 type:complete len:399 (+) Transcript_9469:2856-4052(+)